MISSYFENQVQNYSKYLTYASIFAFFFTESCIFAKFCLPLYSKITCIVTKR